MDEPIEPIPPKSRGKRALELLPELLAHIEYLYVVAVKDVRKFDAYQRGMAILNEK